MWVNIEVIPDREEIVYLPYPMIKRFDSEVNVSFGDRNIIAKIEPAKDLEMASGRGFDNPLIIRFSRKLAATLHIPISLTYKMKFNESNILIGPVIGMLLGNRNHLYNPDHMEKYSDRFGIYDQIGGLIYAFSHKAIDWDNHLAYGLYYNHKESKWKFGRFPLPSVIYRRDFHSSAETSQRLLEITHGKMFNSWRFTKFYLHQYAKRDEKLAPYLPPTELTSSYERVKRFIDRYDNVILKPVHLSRGRGICIIKRDGDSYKVSDYRSSIPTEFEIENDEALKNFFRANEGFFTKYLIQKHLSLAKIDGASFDIRVVMQKEKPGEWKRSGIECRVAAKKSLVTNISRGGYALSIDDAIKMAFPRSDEEQRRIKDQLYDLCFKLCERLDEMGHHFAEFGMDIAVDEDGALWIIEVNVFPSFKGFKTMDYKTYLAIRYTPILYASHLAGFEQTTISRGE